MSNRKKKPGPSDVNQPAEPIVDQATASTPQAESSPEATVADGKNPAAVALGRLGGMRGGPARAAKLSAKKRTEIARKAAQARWEKKT